MLELRRRYNGGAQSPSFSRLPKEYQEVEYLETQGDGAYIQTNVPYDSTRDDYEIECTYFIIQETPYAHIFGASEGGGYNSIIFAQGQSKGRYLGFYNKSTKSLNYTFTSDYGYRAPTKCYFSASKTVLSDINNNAKELFTAEGQGTSGFDSTNKASFCLFTADQSLNTGIYCKALGYIIRSEEATLCNLIPCYRKEDNEAGMYDLVSGEFYTNAGTGTFEVGAEVIG